MLVRVEKQDGAAVCERCILADKPLRRMKGLLGRSGLEPDEGILLRPAGSVHTFFMRFPIDVVFLDGDLSVLKVVTLPAWKTAGARGAKVTLELAAGEAARRGVAPGDRLQIA